MAFVASVVLHLENVTVQSQLHVYPLPSNCAAARAASASSSEFLISASRRPVLFFGDGRYLDIQRAESFSLYDK